MKIWIKSLNFFLFTALYIYSFTFLACNLSRSNYPAVLKIPLNSAEEVSAYLASQAHRETSAENPIYLPFAPEGGLGIQTDEESVWQQLLIAIAAAEKYIELDLTDSAMEIDGIFDPVNSISAGKDKIVSIALPDAAIRLKESFDIGTFRHFYNLKCINGANIVYIGERAFFNLENLYFADFPKTASIGAYAFNNCKKLSSANFPAAAAIEKSAFADAGIVSAHFPMVTSIGDEAFMACEMLTEINFPLAQNIGSKAFYSCSSLILADLQAAENMATSAFGSCINLTEVRFPASCSAGGSVFINCVSLTSFVLTGEGDLSVIEDGKALARNINDGIELVSYPSAAGEIILNGITSIADFAFSGGNNLLSIKSSSVTVIADNAFEGCLALVSADFPAVVSVGEYSFNNCSALVSVNFPVLTEIGEYSFFNCKSLASVEFPALVNISRSLFSGCSNIETAVFLSAVSIDEYAFKNCEKLVSVNLPQARYIGNEAFALDQEAANTSPINIIFGAAAPNMGTGLFSGQNRTVIILVPYNAGGYGDIPAIYDNYDDTAQNWGNGVRGKGWDGFTEGYNTGAVNSNVTVNVRFARQN